MARIVILGGGFGGAAAALTARSLLSNSHEVIVIDRAADSYLCGVNPAVIVGAAEPMSRSIAGLASSGARYVGAEIETIDMDECLVKTSQGPEPFDYLIIALGVSYDWDGVPGGRDAYSFYDRESSLRLRRRLRSFDNGSIVIGVAGTPYRCPPAPFEAALMIDGHLRNRRIRDGCSITVAVPEPQPLGVAGPSATARITDILGGQAIALLTERRVSAIAGSTVAFEDGSDLEADIPIVVPVHRLPQVVAQTGISNGKPFVPVSRDTLETQIPNVFAVGDTNSIPIGQKAGIPKAGVFASGQGRHAAAIVANRLNEGPDPGGYDGSGHCFLMLGPNSGAQIGGRFFAEGGPDVALDEPSGSGRRAKDEWEEAWARFEV